MNKMKVLHILHELKFSGAEIMYADAASIFQRKGCELAVMATAFELGEYAQYFEKAGYQILHHPFPLLKNYFSRIKFYFFIIKMLKKEKYDVVHIHSNQTMWGFALCSWLVNVKTVYTFHSVFPTRSLTYIYHCLLRWTAKNIFKCQFQTISDSVYNHELNLFHNKTTKVYNWYGINRYFPALKGEKETVRKDLGINNETLVLISIGGCCDNKRHSDIIKAVSIIVQNTPDCLYLHLGKGETESQEIQMTNDLGLANKIRFCNNQTDVRKYLIASDVYIMPSRFEGIPITTIEAMACKIPAILYDVPGLRDFNVRGENSILISEDYKMLADKIIYLKENPIIADSIANSAKKLVDDQFNMNTNAAKIFDLYSKK
jgi:glycosyltransferase involved in cell wall biosynthesis